MPDKTEPYDRVTPHLEQTPDKTGRRGADYRLGLEKRPVDGDGKYASTNVEWLTEGEVQDLAREIDRVLPAGIHRPRVGQYSYGTGTFDDPGETGPAVLLRVYEDVPILAQYHVVMRVPSVWQAQAIATILNAE